MSLCLIATDAFALIGIDDYTVLMLHGNGEEGSTNFVDDSFSHHAVTANGNANIDTTQKKFGSGSGLLDTGYLTIPDHSDWDLGSGDFTFDYWVNFNSWNTVNVFMCSTDWGASVEGYLIAMRQSRVLFLATSGVSSWDKANFSGAYSFNLNTWSHIALVRNSGLLALYVDGSCIATQSNSNIINSSGAAMYIGDANTAESNISGYLDEVRISNGIARWTSDFTPPTQEYEVIPEPSTMLLFGIGAIGAALFKRKRPRK